MPLSTRDVLLIIRAKDQASRVIADVGRNFAHVDDDVQARGRRQIQAGQALLGLGVGFLAVGAAGATAIASMTEAAIDFNNQAALTFTQVDQVGVSLEDIKDIVKRVGSEIPAPLEQMQSALYDIFSSMDVSAADAEKMLAAFAKSAVGGQVDVQTAGRATIAIMNAWGYGVDQLDRVMDIQFQLVRKGVGTYQEFATSIGMAIPSARRFGSEVETLAGMLAFMTRNGLSADTAATSAARAFDVMSRPIVAKRLKEIGVNVFDANGNFRQMNDIVTEMGKKFKGLSDAEKAAALNEIFKGQGNTIQARRFFDMAIRSYDELNQRVDEMHDSAGAAQQAYDIMFDQPAAQIQMFQNNLELLRIEFGEFFLPALIDVVKWANELVKKINDMPEATKKTIAKVAALTTAVFLATGAILTLTGSFLIFKGTLTLMGTSIMGFLSKLTFWTLIIAGIAYLIYNNWDYIYPRLKAIWEDLTKWGSAFFDGFTGKAREGLTGWEQRFYEWGRKAREIADNVFAWIKEKGTAFVNWWKSEAWPWLKEAWVDVTGVADTIWDKAWEIGKGFVSWWKTDAWPALKEGWTVAKDEANKLWDKTWELGKGFVSWWKTTGWPGIKEGWNQIKETAQGIWDDLMSSDTGTSMQSFFDKIPEQARTAWEGAKEYGQEYWNVMKEASGSAFDKLKDEVLPTLKARWDELWQGFKDKIGPQFFDTLSQLGDTIAQLFQTLGPILKTLWEILKPILGLSYLIGKTLAEIFGSPLIQAGIALVVFQLQLVEGVLKMIQGWLMIIEGILTGDFSKAWEGVKTVWAGAGEILVAPFKLLWEWVQDVIDIFINLGTKILEVDKWMLELWGKITEWVGQRITSWTWWRDMFKTVGGAIVDGIIAGIKAAGNGIMNTLKGLVPGGANGPLAKALGWAGGAAGFLGDKIPGLASGGSAWANMPHIVGERGPELFVPGASGTIMSSAAFVRAMASGGQQRGGDMITIQVQGPIEDRDALAGAVASEVAWNRFTKGYG